MENQTQEKMKFCKYCGGQIPDAAVVCTLCGKQVEELKSSQVHPSIVINNDNNNANINSNKNTIATAMHGMTKNKWVALVLCIFLGYLGAHKFYEGKAGMGILYLFTGGLFFIGVIIDFLSLLAKPTHYIP